MLPQILADIKALLNEGKPVKVIFDLDSTVFDVSTRITRIFHEFANLPRNQKLYPSQTKVLLQMTPHPQDYGVRRTLSRYEFPMHDMTFFHELVEYWKQHFFSDKFLKYDQPYPGVVEFIGQISKAGAEIMYLTGRDIPRMHTGTVNSLKHHGLPLLEKYENLILKPGTDISDVEFKRSFFKTLKHEHVWFFENEPANILICLQEAPHVKAVFVDTVHSESGPLPPSTVMSLKKWTME